MLNVSRGYRWVSDWIFIHARWLSHRRNRRWNWLIFNLSRNFIFELKFWKMTSTLRIDIHVGKKLQLNFYKSVRYHALYTFFLRLFINFHEFFPLFHSKIFFDRIHSLYFYIFSSLPYPVKTNVLKYNSNSSFFLFLFFNKIYIYIYISYSITLK